MIDSENRIKLGDEEYRIGMFADTSPNRWRRSGLAVAAAAAAAVVVGLLD